MSSNYKQVENMWNDEEYKICPRCKGSGQDRDGADCLECYGEGEVPLVSSTIR